MTNRELEARLRQATERAVPDELDAILSRCDSRHLVQDKYSPGCMQRRNKYMVDHSSLHLAYFAGLPGGTMNTIVYARRSGVETVIISI